MIGVSQYVSAYGPVFLYIKPFPACPIALFMNVSLPPLISQRFLLEKYPGKGGWTYARIPEIPPDKHAPFGWVRVRGSIDGFEIKNYHLMPMGDGMLFLPVRAEIRKKIRKEAGDWVHIILYPDNDPVDIPEELLLCLSEEPGAKDKFLQLTSGKQKEYIDWIFAAKREETRVRRIVQLLENL